MPDSWRLEIPAPTQWVSANDRSHWASKARLVKEWRTSAHLWANAERLPHITTPVIITGWVHRTDTRRADAHNRILTVKACIDGLVDAGVLDDDSDKHVTAVVMRGGEVVDKKRYPLGLLTLDIETDGGALVVRSEARLRTKIWDDEDFLILPGHQQLSYLFMISQPDISHCGVLSLRLKRWAKKLKYTPEQLDKALAGLEAARFVVVDHDEEELLVRSFLRNDGVCKNFKVLKAAAGSLSEICSKPIRETLANEIERAFHEGLGSESTNPTLLGMLNILGRPHHGLFDGASDGASYDPSMGHQEALPMGDTKSDGVGVGVGARFKTVVTSSSSPDGETKKKPAKRGTRVPDGFTFTDEMQTWARLKAPLVADNLGYHTEQFVDYWIGRNDKLAVKRDWIAAWRWWIRKANNDAAERNDRRGEPSKRRVEVDAARCGKHPRELAEHCTICDSEKRGAA